MPDELRAHFRYPEDLFRVQTNMWGRYHLTDPGEFYQNQPGWLVAQDPGHRRKWRPRRPARRTATTAANQQSSVATGSRSRRIAPYYLQFKLPGEETSEFVLLRPFVPFSENDSRQELTAFMVARSDPEHYGELLVYEMPTSPAVDGPAIVASNIESDTAISSRAVAAAPGGVRGPPRQPADRARSRTP